MADQLGATKVAVTARRAKRKPLTPGQREAQRLRYHEKKLSDPGILERNRLRSAARRAKLGRPKRTPKERDGERVAERRRYEEGKNDPEVITKRKAIRYARHQRDPEKKREYDRRWLEAHKDDAEFRSRMAKNMAAHYKRHPDRAAERSRLWYAANSEKLAQKQRERAETDLGYRILRNLRGRIAIALGRARAGKATDTRMLLGCAIEHLCEHLQTKFRDGMTWENYGPLWHVDHIKPCALFDLSDPEQQRACFHWTNLQPLLAAENLRKGKSFVEVKAA